MASSRTTHNFTPTTHHDTYPFIDPTKNDFKSKHVFITGASKGIGKATALAFARGGASIIAIASRSPAHDVAAEISAAASSAGHPPPTVLAYAMDVSDRAAIDSTAEAFARDMHGRLDILVNNAGFLESFVPMADSDPDEWWTTWTVNVRGLYLVTRALLPLMLRGGDKRICNLSSVGAHNKAVGGSGYQTTKLVVARLTEFLMVEYGGQGVMALCVHPGGVMTSLAASLPEFIRKNLIDTVETAADTIAWLMAEKREWLAGRYVSANWDMEELSAMKEEIMSKDLLKFRMAI